jgi:hypothetical protein
MAMRAPRSAFLSTSLCEYKRMKFSYDPKSIPAKCKTPRLRLRQPRRGPCHLETWQVDIMGRLQW